MTLYSVSDSVRHDLARLIATFFLAVYPAIVHAQSTPPEGQLRAAVDSMFSAMRRSDTAAVRSAFLTTGRVVPFPASAASGAAPNGLTVDAFVAFAGQQAPGTWNERILNAQSHVDGTLGTLWFDYDVIRSGAAVQCGVNSVQLLQTASGWKILSMAFTSRRSDCPVRGPRHDVIQSESPGEDRWSSRDVPPASMSQRRRSPTPTSPQ
jgi:hypothetical protein